jgi:phosphoribosylamine--glycine ligase
VTVVVAAENYPRRPVVGDVITGADADGVLHAGTALDDAGRLVSAGGRVLSCTASGPDLAAARDAAYAQVRGVGLRGSHHRSDIAARAIAGEIRVPRR